MANICEDNNLYCFSISNGNCIQVKFIQDGCGVRIKGRRVPCRLNVLPCCLKQRSLEAPKGFVTHDHCPTLTGQQQGRLFTSVALSLISIAAFPWGFLLEVALGGLSYLQANFLVSLLFQIQVHFTSSCC